MEYYNKCEKCGCVVFWFMKVGGGRWVYCVKCNNVSGKVE